MAKKLDEKLIKQISSSKKEPHWMLDLRLHALEVFQKSPLPSWGPDLSFLDFNKINYYPLEKESEKKSWKDVPKDIKETFEKLGIPKAEREYLAGVKSQYDSQVIYGSLQKSLKKQGVIFESMELASKNHPDLVKKYFGRLIPPEDNKFAALNSAAWSGGSFIYVPKNVKIPLPLQAYFYINASSSGQFERTLIILEENSNLHYIEGCSAPVYSSSSLHSGVVEIFVGENASCQYSTIQNWYKNVYNLVTKRSLVEKKGKMYWLDCNIGSKVTMKYPACILKGENSYAEMLSISYAGENQIQDSGAKMIHLGKNTKSKILSKSLSQSGGISNYRGLINISATAQNSVSTVKCDSLLLDSLSLTNSYPTNNLENSSSAINHEATITQIEQKKLNYLASRGLSKNHASSLIISGFIDPIVKKYPFEYAIELNRLLEIELEKN